MKFIKKIFSIKNEYDFENKNKILYFLGIKIRFKNPFGKYKPKGQNNCLNFSDKTELKVLKSIVLSITGDNNLIILDKSYLKKNPILNIKITGNNNIINIGKTNYLNALIVITGNKSIFELNDTQHYMNFNAHMGQRNEDSYNKIIIDKNCSMGDASFFVSQKNTSIIIGRDCMFSDRIKIQGHDGHKILDNITGKLINNEKINLKIGDHVWVGRSSTILKNAQIPSNSIVGCSSVVTKKFTQENIILAGNPAKIIKTNINWDRESNF